MFRAGDADLQLRGLQGRHQRAVQLRVIGDHQQPRFAAHGGKREGAVILRQRIARRFHPRLVVIKTGRGEGLRKRKQILARRQFHRLLAQELLVAIQPHRRRAGSVRLHKNFCLEGLALLELRRQLQSLNGNVVGAGHAEGNHVYCHALRTSGPHRVDRVADVLVAIRKQDQPFLAGFGKGGGAELDGGGEIGALRIDHRLNLREIERHVGQPVNARLRAEDDDPGLVRQRLWPDQPGDELARRLLLLGRDAIRAIEEEKNVHAFDRTPPLPARQRQHNQRANHKA